MPGTKTQSPTDAYRASLILREQIRNADELTHTLMHEVFGKSEEEVNQYLAQLPTRNAALEQLKQLEAAAHTTMN